MITSIYLGSIQLDTNKRVLSSIRNLSFPFIQYSAIRKGSFAGQSISPSNFASYKLALEFTVAGSSFANLADEREQFVADLAEILAEGSELLKINKSNGVNTQVEIKGVDIDADADARDPITAKFRIEMEAEYPFLQSQTLQTVTGMVFSGGGMPVPMPVPMDMSAGGANEFYATNNGNAEAYPVFKFYGPLTSPSLTNFTTGKTLNINYNLSSPSDIMIVDTFLRTVLILPANSNGRRYVSGEFWTIKPGVNAIRLGSGNPAGTVDVIFRDHYYGI